MTSELLSLCFFTSLNIDLRLLIPPDEYDSQLEKFKATN